MLWGESSSRLGIRPRGRACGRRCHVESGGGNFLGMVGLSLDAQNSGIDILELPGECQLNQVRVWGDASGRCGERSGAQHARDEG